MKVGPTMFLGQMAAGKALPHVLALVGEEGYYRDKVRQAFVKAALGPDADVATAVTVFAEKSNLEEVAQAINTYPFFSGTSVVLLKDESLLAGEKTPAGGKHKEGKGDELLRILGDVPDYCYVLVQAVKLDGRQKLAKHLLKDFTYVDCAPVRPSGLGPWLREEAARYGARLEPEALETILAYLANVEFAPLQLLEQELAKLSLYAGERKTWTRADIEQVFAALPEVSRFALTNAIADKKKILALQLLAEEERKKINILPVAGGVAFQLRRLLQIKECQRLRLGSALIGKKLKLAPFIVNLALRQSKNFTEQSLRQALLAVDQLSVDYRSGGRGYERLEEIILAL